MSAAIVEAVTVLNGLISATQHIEEYRQTVAAAIAQGRDVSDDDLAAIAKRIESNLTSAMQDAQAAEKFQ